MKLLITITPEIEELAQKEIKELVGATAELGDGYVLTQSLDKTQVLTLCKHMQTAQRITLFLTKITSLEEINWAQQEAPFAKLFTKEVTYKALVKNLEGQENRLDVARKIVGSFSEFTRKTIGFAPEIELKKPDLNLLVYHEAQQYLIGIDLLGTTINNRAYRMFPNSASFKGDIGLYFLEKLGWTPKDSLLSLFSKDGVLLIEAAIKAGRLTLIDLETTALTKIPLFENREVSEERPEFSKVLLGLDESAPAVRAARKNSSIAGVKSLVEFKKINIEEPPQNIEEKFGLILVHFTKKDENKCNEVYSLIEKFALPKARMLFISRPNFEVPLPSIYNILETHDFFKGDNGYRLVLAQKS